MATKVDNSVFSNSALGKSVNTTSNGVLTTILSSKSINDKTNIESILAGASSITEVDPADYKNLEKDPNYMMIIHRHGRAQNDTITIMAYLPENFASSVSSSYDEPFRGGFISNDKLALGARLAGYATTNQIMTMQVWEGSAPMEFSMPIVFLLDTDTEKDIMEPVRNLMKLTLPSMAKGNNGTAKTPGRAGSIAANAAVLRSPGPKLALANVKDAPAQVGDRLTKGSSEADNIDFGGVLTKIVDVFKPGESSGDAAKNAGGAVNEGIFNAESLFENIKIEDNISFSVGRFFHASSVVITDVSQEYEIKLDRYSKKPIALNVTISLRTFFTPIAEDIDLMFPKG